MCRTVKVIGGSVDNLEDLVRKLGQAIDRNTRLGRKLVAEERRKAIAEAEAAAAAGGKAQAEKLKRLQLQLNTTVESKE